MKWQAFGCVNFKTGQKMASAFTSSADARISAVVSIHIDGWQQMTDSDHWKVLYRRGWRIVKVTVEAK